MNSDRSEPKYPSDDPSKRSPRELERYRRREWDEDEREGAYGARYGAKRHAAEADDDETRHSTGGQGSRYSYGGPGRGWGSASPGSWGGSFGGNLGSYASPGRGYSGQSYYRSPGDEPETHAGEDRAPAYPRRGAWDGGGAYGSPSGSYRGSRTWHSQAWSGPHIGKGPKGYKRSDAAIVEEANRALERDGDVDASEIEVSCTSGVITLRGKVEDRRAKRAAEDCVEDVYGVHDVHNELKVDKGFFAKLFGMDTDRDDDLRSSSHRAH